MANLNGIVINNRYVAVYRDHGQCHGHDYTAKAEFTKKIPSGDTKHRHVCNHCGFIYYSNPKIATGVLCTYKDKILLTLRNIAPKKGFWCFPGGFLESGYVIYTYDSLFPHSQIYCLCYVLL